MVHASKTTENSNWMTIMGIKRDPIPVLIIGNNPIEMTSIYNMLVGNQSKNYTADVCFDVKDCFDRIAKQKPQIILIDDNLYSEDINKMVRVLRQNAKTRDIKIIVLKSTNWNYNVIDNVDDYILKDTLNMSMIDRLIYKNLHQEDHLLV